MAEAESVRGQAKDCPTMRKIGQEIKDRWPEARVAMAHRTGRLEIGEPSVVVSASAPHRARPPGPRGTGPGGSTDRDG